MIARLFLCLVLFAGTAGANETARIVYLGLEGDTHYEPRRAYTGVLIGHVHRPVDGARLAMKGTRVLGRALGLSFLLEERLLATEMEAAPALAEALGSGAAAVLLDLPEDAMARALEAPRQGDALLFNIRHRSAHWRGADCAPDLLHTIPSLDMLSDALAQHLAEQGWQSVLLLSGPADADAERVEAARRSIAKFGLELAGEKRFDLSNDPRQRDRTNLRLLTGDVPSDVVWLIDTVGEFGRFVPYATYHPTPVVGTEGLEATAWHETYERYGAPQLNQRFRRATGRPMAAEDWAAWAAVRTVVEAVSRAGAGDLAAISGYARSGELSLDLYKGVPGSYRPWNGQLRQPVLLATHNAVIAWAPLEGFKHEREVLDTLGADRAESRCPR